MALALVMPERATHALRKALQQHLPDVAIDHWPNLVEGREYPMAIAWNPEPGSLASIPGLRAIHSLGAGVDALLQDETIPSELPIARIVDPDLSEQMAEYTLLQLLAYRRHLRQFYSQQNDQTWRQAVPREIGPVGVLGLGEIGQRIADALLRNGFEVHGWSRGEKSIEQVVCHHGEQGLHTMQEAVSALVCVLPLTEQTRHLINREFLQRCQSGVLLINIARGGLVDDEALLAALSEGRVGHAILDVFTTEPLPEDHPFWRHESVTVTPHVAGLTNPRTATAQIAENYRRVLDGRAMHRLVDRRRGY